MPHHRRGKQQTPKKGRPAATSAPRPAPAPPVVVPEGLIETLVTRLAEGPAPTAVAGEIAANPLNLQAPLLRGLAEAVSVEAQVPLLLAVLEHPLAPGAQAQVVELLARAQTPPALEALVALGQRATSREVRRAAKGALFQLRSAGVAVPRSGPPPAGDVRTWPVADAWASRIDDVGSQLVTLARTDPSGALAYVNAVVTEERGITDGTGELGVSFDYLQGLLQEMGGPNAVTYRCPAEYVRWRVRQAEEAGRGRGHRTAPDFAEWRHLLAGVADDWQPDLDGLCASLADPGVVDQTAALMHAQEFGDWWPDPVLGSDLVRDFVDDALAALDALPDGGRGGDHDGDLPYADLLGETQYVMLLSPFNAAGEEALATAISAHLEAIFPPGRRRRYRQRLLHMGYLSTENERPNLARLIMTAAWALDPASGVAAVDHPFLRQMLHKSVEMELLISGDEEGVDDEEAGDFFTLDSDER